MSFQRMLKDRDGNCYIRDEDVKELQKEAYCRGISDSANIKFHLAILQVEKPIIEDRSTYAIQITHDDLNEIKNEIRNKIKYIIRSMI